MTQGRLISYGEEHYMQTAKHRWALIYFNIFTVQSMQHISIISFTVTVCVTNMLNFQTRHTSALTIFSWHTD